MTSTITRQSSWHLSSWYILKPASFSVKVLRTLIEDGGSTIENPKNRDISRHLYELIWQAVRDKVVARPDVREANYKVVLDQVGPSRSVPRRVDRHPSGDCQPNHWCYCKWVTTGNIYFLFNGWFSSCGHWDSSGWGEEGREGEVHHSCEGDWKIPQWRLGEGANGNWYSWRVWHPQTAQEVFHNSNQTEDQAFVSLQKN